MLITLSALVILAFGVIGIVTVKVTSDRMVARVNDTLLAAGTHPPRPNGEGDVQRMSGTTQRATATLVLDSSGHIFEFDPSGW